VFGSNGNGFENLQGKTASPGWYNSAAFEQEAHAAMQSVNDAFLTEATNNKPIKADLGKWT
jgi:enoyl-[acyl-carrier protein] reductase/trans-2-enoyl-CoA reductase (NAD+)